MPRRIPDYPDAFAFWNYVATFGSYISVVGLVLFFYILFRVFSDRENIHN
jgi:cytochrome c oxidase subunit 1